MIQVKDLKKGFGNVEVLKGINATFEKGKTNMIIGASGSGKSVFLKNMLGLFLPDSGNILYNEEPLNEMDDDRKGELRMDMGMLFQHSALFDSMTVEENVMFPLRMFTKMRYDYLTRFSKRFRIDGFNRLINEGFNAKNNHSILLGKIQRHQIH